jgi:hypothetical protein
MDQFLTRPYSRIRSAHRWRERPSSHHLVIFDWLIGGMDQFLTRLYLRSADWWHGISSSPDRIYHSIGRLVALTSSSPDRIFYQPTGGGDAQSPPGCPCDLPTVGSGDIQSPPGVSADWCPSAPDTIPGPVHPARLVRPVIGPWPINHARLPGHPATPVCPWVHGHLDFGFQAVLPGWRHDGPGHWPRLFLRSAETFSPHPAYLRSADWWW